MKFYITEETKKEIEDMLNKPYATDNKFKMGVNYGKKNILSMILDNHIIITNPQESTSEDYIMD